MPRLKVMTIVGTRPEIIKLSRVIAELDAHTDHRLVHSGQNYDYELNGIFFQQMRIRRPDIFLEAVGKTAAETIGLVIAKSDLVFESEKPDAVLIYGDTNTCLAAISAKRRKIPIFHMEAGNRCFDQRVPEEINRKILDHISDINLPLTEHARRYLLAEGLRPETIIKTGSSMTEVLQFYKKEIDQADVLDRLQLSHRNYFVVSTHREENVDTRHNLVSLIDSWNGLAETYQKPVLVSVHPRTRQRIESLQSDAPDLNPLVQLCKPFGFFDYIKLQQHAACVLSDSGTITEESSILGFPAVTLRQAHERPEGMDEGTLIMCGLDRDRVLQAVRMVVDHFDEDRRTFQTIADYQSENVSKKVVRIILSYVDYINRTVWRKST